MGSAAKPSFVVSWPHCIYLVIKRLLAGLRPRGVETPAPRRFILCNKGSFWPSVRLTDAPVRLAFAFSQPFPTYYRPFAIAQVPHGEPEVPAPPGSVV